MTRTKKLLALVLALMMAFTTLAMPAMALEYGVARNTMYCSNCESYQSVGHTPETKTYKVIRNVAGCSKTNYTHEHTIEYYNCSFICPGCKVVLATHTHTRSEDCHYKG